MTENSTESEFTLKLDARRIVDEEGLPCVQVRVHEDGEVHLYHLYPGYSISVDYVVKDDYTLRLTGERRKG